MKGSLASAKVILDLTQKGYEVYLPVSEHGLVDIVALKDGIPYRLQVKYSSDGSVRNYTVHSKSGKNIRTTYKSDDFDFYAVYLSEVDFVAYVPQNLGGVIFRFDESKNGKAYYHYQDFSDIRTFHNKRH